MARALADQINLLGRPEFVAVSVDGELRIENIAGNVFTTTFAVNGTARPDSVEAGAAVVAGAVLEGVAAPAPAAAPAASAPAQPASGAALIPSK